MDTLDVVRDTQYLLLEQCIIEMMDIELSLMEREFAMQRALSLLDNMKTTYIGGR
jgi:hypothetical protein